MVGFITNFKLIGLYSDQLPEFALRAFVLDRYVSKYLPKLFAHFKKIGIKL